MKRGPGEPSENVTHLDNTRMCLPLLWAHPILPLHLAFSCDFLLLFSSSSSWRSLELELTYMVDMAAGNGSGSHSKIG